MLSLNDLLMAYAISSNRHGSYARALETLIDERERDLRRQIGGLVSEIAIVENWKDDQRLIASQFTDICPASELERLCRHFLERLEFARWSTRDHK